MGRKIALLCHGILGDTKSGPNRLEPYFQRAGYWTLRIPAGWGFFVLPALKNRTVAALIAAFAILLGNMGNEVVAVGHSNGARVLALASEYGAPFKVLVFISGAVDRDAKIGNQVGTVINCYVPGDRVLQIAGAIPFHPWGIAGQAGIRTDRKPNQWNADMGRGDLPGAEGVRLGDHSEFFERGKIEKLGPWLVNTVEYYRAPTEAVAAT